MAPLAKTTFQTLDADAFTKLTGTATSLADDGGRDRILQLPDQSVFKIFRRKTGLSSTMFRSYAKRFADASLDLHERNIPTVQVLDAYNIPHLKRQAVRYHFVEGTTIRQQLTASRQPPEREQLESLAKFMHELHERGVLFRGLHLGNIVQLQDDSLGLIDISGCHCQTRPISRLKRIRNFKPMLRSENDAQLLGQRGFETLVDFYVNTDLDDVAAARMKRDIMKQAAMVEKTRCWETQPEAKSTN